MLPNNLPQLPGTDNTPPKPSHDAYILCGNEFVQVGSAYPASDERGLEIEFKLGVSDGETVYLRETQYVKRSENRKPKAKRSAPKMRQHP